MGTDTWQILPPDAFAYDVRRVVDAAYHFFDQPPAQKEHASDPTSRTGFRPFGIEYAQWPDRPDQMETFSICGAHVGTGPRFPLRSAVSRDLYEIAVDAFVALHRMASSFVRQAFQDRADVVVSREWVENNTITGSFLQINSYTMSANELRPAQDWHEDADLLTLGTADGAGLQVRLDDGGYVPVANVGGAHLAMVGGVLSELLGGEPAPCYHRVVATEGVDRRISVQLFVSPSPDGTVRWPSVPGVAVDRVLARSNLSGLASGLPPHEQMVQ